MDYEQEYNKLVNAIKVLQEANPSDEGIQNWVNDNVPELAESRNEKVRKWIYNYFRSCFSTWIHPDITCGEILDWLEKQGEQKPINDTDEDVVRAVENTSILDMVNEPKFKVGDWVVHDISDGRKVIRQIINMTNKSYILDGEDFNTFYFNDLENDYHLWTIQDAKDGDVLASNKSIFIFQKEYIGEKPTAYCGLMNGLFIEGKGACWTNEKCYPATKEQRDLLFSKMKEAGYTFDFEKKELKKIEQKPAECRQETKPNGGIVLEDFNEGDGFYKVNLAYLSKSQVELVENLVTSWQNPTNNTVEWSEEDERVFHHVLSVLEEYGEEHLSKSKFVCNWLKSLRSRSRWKPSKEQMKALHDMNLTGNISYAGQGQVLIELYNDLKKL